MSTIVLFSSKLFRLIHKPWRQKPEQIVCMFPQYLKSFLFEYFLSEMQTKSG